MEYIIKLIFNLYTVLLAMEEQMGRPNKIQATGGLARSPLWRQMMADIFDQTVVIPESLRRHIQVSAQVV